MAGGAPGNRVYERVEPLKHSSGLSHINNNRDRPASAFENTELKGNEYIYSDTTKMFAGVQGVYYHWPSEVVGQPW